jgi:hypothetical protein
MSGIFLSYRNIRRSYAPMFADWVLRQRFGDGNVFEAGRANLPGIPFPQAILGWLQRCSLLVVFIDPPWLAEMDKLRDGGDWVRREILHAIEHGKKILPILLDGADMPSGHLLPSELAPMTKSIALRMSTRTVHADMLRLVGEVEHLAPELVLATLTDVDRPAPASAGALIRPEHEVLPFRPRPQLDELVRWSQRSDGPPAALMVGPLAAGKTRLALRLCSQLRALRWAAGLLSPSAGLPALQRLGEVTTHCLVVIDDAERHPRSVTTALRAIAAAPRSPVRLLLLARGTGEWLQLLRDDPDDRVVDLVDRMEVVDLAPLVPVEGDLAQARVAIGDRLGMSVTPPQAEQPMAATLLELQVAVLADLMPADRGATSLWRRLADLERDQWRRMADTLGLSWLRREHLIEVMAVVAMFGAATEPQAEALLAATRGFSGRSAVDVDAGLSLIRSLLPGPLPFNVVEPQPLADELIAGLMASGRGLSKLLAVVSDDQARTALAALGRCLTAYPEYEHKVAEFFEAAPSRLLRLAMTVLPAVPDPTLLVARMTAALDKVPDADLVALTDALPQRSQVLDHFAVELTRRALAACGGKVVDPHTARLSRLLATRLSARGERMDDAVAAAAAAVAYLQANPDESCPQPAELAEAYAALALAHDLDPAGAQDALAAGAQAVERFRPLAADDRHRAALATALTNQLVRLHQNNRTDQAIPMAREAYELASALCEKRPAAYRSLYGDTADNLSVLTGDVPLARQALRLRRDLARARPDAYRPQLAATLFNLGLLLVSDPDRHDEVRALWQESAAVFGGLATADPQRFGLRLAAVQTRLRDLAR